MNIILFLEKEIKNILEKLGFSDDVQLSVSNRPDLGDYQYNGCMKLAGTYKKNPRDIASLIVNELKNTNYFSDVNIAGPGFINMTLSDEILIKYINQITKDFKINTYHVDTDETIFLDYGGANVAKELHAGHLRSPNIGEAIKRLCESVGYKTISDVHLGDWGRPMGLIICELSKRYPDLVFFDKEYDKEYPNVCPVSLQELNEIYPYASSRAKEDENYLEEARNFTTRLQNREKGIYDLWKTFYNLSVDEIKRVYKLLGCTFDLWDGEMASLEYIPALLEILKPYLYESNGAMVMDISKEDDKKELPPLMVLKSDGSSKYETRDLATIYKRMKLYNPDEIWYVVDERQALNFEQVFRGSYKSGLVSKDTKLCHYGFGTINGTDGKPFKTRDGGVMQLSTLIDMVHDEIAKRVVKKLDDNVREDVIEKLTIATIKYTDLLPYRKTDYIFDPVKFSSFEGKTGPYILYTLVRCKSILRNNDEIDYKIDIVNDNIRDIYVKIVSLSSELYKAYKNASVNVLCEYLYNLCNLYNKFYNDINISHEEDIKLKKNYLSLTKLVGYTIENILDLLAIDSVDVM